MISVRPVTRQDAPDWLAMRKALWPDDPENSHPQEIEEFLAGRLRMPLQVFVAIDESRVVGFAELSIRAYAEGCVTDQVAFLEGWYVEPDVRQRGVGRALVEAAEEWGREQGCREFGSDALLDNHVSAAAHKALGFEEVVQIRCFKKEL